MSKRNHQSSKTIKSILVMFLCIAMSVSMLYQPVYAKDNNTTTTVNTTAENFEKEYVNVFDNQYGSLNEENINYEDNSLREEFVKHFVMHDGSTQAVVYETQVHELDENGTYQEIDNTLSDNNNKEFENTKNNKWKVKFSKEAKKTLVHIHEDNKNIKWGIANFNNVEASFLVDDEPYTKLSNKAVSAVVVYEDILNNIDVQYQLSHQKVKENVILKSKEAQHTIYYNLDTNGYDISVVDNQIVLSKNNKEDYIIEAPYMMDNNGVFHDGIIFSYENNQVKMELDSEWLLAEDRAYPVTVDPTIKKTLSGSSVTTTSVYVASPNSTQMYSYGALYCGREYSSYGNLRGAAKFTLPTLDESNMVVQATITLSQLNYYGGGSVYVKAAPITTNIAMSSLTWNKLNGKTGTNSDFTKVSSSTVGKWFSFDITKIVRDWYSTGKNYGLAFISGNESSSYRYATFVTRHNSGLSSRFPYASVTYISQDGLENYLTYQTMNTVSMGSFNVGDFNGNLIYTYNDFSMSGNHKPVGISHVFNHHQRAKVDTVSSTMKFGKGMRLNVSMKIEYNSTNDYYTLTDEDGTVHYFYKDSTTGKYLKEFDSNVKITVNENDYTIDNASQRILFNKTTGLISEVQDKVSNKKQVYTYNTNNQLVTITDGANRDTTFTYNTDNYLTSITYADNRTISYTYTNNQLATITQPDGNTITFTYNGDLLESVSNINEGKVQVEYFAVSPRRVSKLTRYGKNNTEGDSISFTYNIGDTVVTDEDGYALTYMFDLSGHTVCVKDSEGNAIYGQYENSNDNNKHSLSFESKLQTTTINLAKNHSPVDTSNWTSDTTIRVVDTNDTQAEFSGKAFKLTDEDGIYQVINYPLAKGESFTISAYVKVNGMPIVENDIRGVAIGFSGTSIYERSEFYPSTNGWKRISYTYTAQEDIAAGEISIAINTYNMIGETLVKNIQLEKGTVVNRYNFIENGHFYDATGTTNISYWTRNDQLTTSDKITTGYDGNGYYVVGSMSNFKSLYQILPVKGNEGDVFVLSGWGKGNAMPQQSLQNTVTGNTEDRKTSLAINFLNSQGETIETREVFFSSMSNSWQYASGSITAPVDYEALQIVARFAFQTNSFTFDNIQLYMESFGTSYEHDDKGRVIASQDIEGNIVKTYYKDITITEEDGTESTTDVVDYVEYKRKDDTNYLIITEYTYTNGKLSKEITYEGSGSDRTKIIETEYTYDNNGNLVSTTVNGEKSHESGQVVYSSNYISSYTNDKGAVTSYQYNETTGQLNKVIQKGTNNESEDDDIVTSYVYDPNTARLQSVSNGDSKVEYTYTTLGLIDTIQHNTDASSKVAYKFIYDEFGNVSSIQVGNGTTYNNLAAYVYKTNNGLLDNVVYGTNEKISYVYDDLGRVTSIKEDDVVKYSWEYGMDGKVGRFIDHTLTVNGITKYEYDFIGNVVLEERGNGTLFNEYDSRNLLKNTGYSVSAVSASTSFEYNAVDELTNVCWNTDNTDGSVEYGRDDLRRINSATYLSGETQVLQTIYDYLDVKDDNTKTTSAIEKVIQKYDSTDHEFTYSYNEFGNIVNIKNDHGSSVTNSYEYDKLNQLIREDNQELNKTYTYRYDNGGNIIEVNTYDYTNVSDLTGLEPSKTDTYMYNDGTWKDLLKEYNDHSITYDTIGNPTIYHDGKQFTWDFRRLERIVDGNTTIDYSYNQDGIRTSKKVGNTTTSYFVSGDRILHETTNNETIYYEYDGTGKVRGFVLNGNRYTYVKNGLNDIIGILDGNANLVATYKYDAWGNVSVTNLTSSDIGDKNPFRYRGYYYDSETGYYYLNSRYYDPVVKRFINADSYASTGQGILGHNMFAYCQNNPVMYYDSTGTMNVMAEIIGGGGDDTSGNSQSNAGRSVTYQNKNPKPKSKLQEDIENFDLFNTDEQKVIDANYFSIYKGTPYIIVPNQTAAFTFGAVFFGSRVTDKEIVKHEYGHSVQLKKVGLVLYTTIIVLPSVFCFQLYKKEIITYEEYYNLPWESNASELGGANLP